MAPLPLTGSKARSIAMQLTQAAYGGCWKCPHAWQRCSASTPRLAASQKGFVHSFGTGMGLVTLLQSLIEPGCWPPAAMSRGRRPGSFAVKHGDRIEAEVVGASQDVLRRVRLAQRGSRVPVGRRQELAQAGAPVSGEDRILDVVMVGRAERGAALQEVVAHGDIGEADRPERREGGLPALLERAPTALVEGATDLGELDSALELGVPGQEQGGEHL